MPSVQAPATPSSDATSGIPGFHTFHSLWLGQPVEREEGPAPEGDPVGKGPDPSIDRAVDAGFSDLARSTNEASQANAHHRFQWIANVPVRVLTDGHRVHPCERAEALSSAGIGTAPHDLHSAGQLPAAVFAHLVPTE